MQPTDYKAVSVILEAPYENDTPGYGQRDHTSYTPQLAAVPRVRTVQVFHSKVKRAARTRRGAN